MSKYVIYILILTLFIFSCSEKSNTIEYKPIGYFTTKYSMKTGAPRQGVLDTTSNGIITLDKSYTDALKDLNRFEYIWVLYHFNQAVGSENIVTPPKSNHKFGLFATRSPRRPNPIGLSLIRLDSIKFNKLYVSFIDAFNNTPVLDIKPFLPSVDYRVSIKNMETEIYLGHHDENFISDSLARIFVKGKNIQQKK